ncbi:hypothetical protein KEM52_005118, partial [Ascosphaera acerosa]
YGIAWVEKQSTSAMRVISTEVTGMAKLAKKVQVGLRLLALVSSVLLLVCVALISNTPAYLAYIIRVGPIVSIIHCAYALWFLLRRKTRSSSTSASYMVFAGIFDLVLDGFFAYSAYVLYMEWDKRDGRWSTLINNRHAKPIIIPAAFITDCSSGGFHLISLCLDLYLFVVYYRLAKLPPGLRSFDFDYPDSQPAERHRLDMWRMKRGMKRSDSTLVEDHPASPMLANFHYPAPEPKHWQHLSVREVPFDQTRQQQQQHQHAHMISESSSRYSRPTTIISELSVEEQQVGSLMHSPRKPRGRSEGRSSSPSRLYSAGSESTFCYSDNEQELPRTLSVRNPDPTSKRNFSASSVKRVVSDWYHQAVGEPALNEPHGTVVHKPGNSISTHGPDHVYSYCGVSGEIREEDEEDDYGEEHEEHDLGDRSRNSHRLTAGLNQYTQVSDVVDDAPSFSDYVDADVPSQFVHQDSIVMPGPRSHLSQDMLLKVPQQAAYELAVTHTDEIERNYNPLTGSIRTVASAALPDKQLPNQPRGLTPTSKDRFYSKPDPTSSLDTIVQSPPTASSDHFNPDGILAAPSSDSGKHKRNRSKYDALLAQGASDETDQHSTPAPAISGPVRDAQGDREGRVVSNSGVDRFAGDSQPPPGTRPVGDLPSNSADQPERTASPTRVSGPKLRKVSGQKPSGTVPGVANGPADEAKVTPATQARLARELPAPGKYKSPGWAKFAGL